MALLLQVPGVQGEQPSGPIKLTWRQGQSVPEHMASPWGAAVVHGNTAYFSNYHSVYSYTVPENKWTKLPQCKQGFGMAVINDALTTIGGRDGLYVYTNTLLSLSGDSWEEVLPPMPTKRAHPAAANTPTHLVVAGGTQSLPSIIYHLDTVEVLNTETLQWSTASSLPPGANPQMTTCGGCIYLASSDNKVFSCSVEDLLKSINSSDCSVWTRLARVHGSSLVTLRGSVLAIGGGDARIGAIHCYDVTTNSWSVIGDMPTPRIGTVTAVLPSNELMVVGGVASSITEIASCQ